MQAAKQEPKVTRRIFGTAVFGVFYVVCVALTAIAVLFALSGSDGEAQRALPALQINLILILALGAYLILRVKKVLFPTGSSRRAPRLHRRFVLIFSLGALVPAIFVGLFFSALMSRNLNDVFGPTVLDTMNTSQEVSDVYLADKIDEIRRDVYSIADDLNSAVSVLPNRITYTEFLITQAVFREHPAVYVLDGSGRILAQAKGPAAPTFAVPSREMFELATDGALTFSTRNEIDYVMALYKLKDYEDAYVYTGRYVRAGVLSNIEKIDQIEQSLTQYTGNFGALNRVFLITYIEVAMLIAYAAIWLGLLLANRLVSPLSDMVDAAEKVRGGDLTTRINVTGTWDEIGDLASAFNRMTRQLSSQRQDLVREHDVSEQRREFSEAVLSGVSAGVVGTDWDAYLNARFTDSSCTKDACNKAADDTFLETDSLWVMDFATHYQLNEQAQGNLKVDNLLDKQEIVTVPDYFKPALTGHLGDLPPEISGHYALANAPDPANSLET